ncbi:MAG: 50S ribosomal protein L2 [Coxiellaceae bacterium]|jgi:large subunit ribosomal protein L2|nr:50S ribosomal protein L2 [Coxiellaceae bacterium]
MTIVKTRPTSPARRFVIKVVNHDLHKGKPYAPLLVAKQRGRGSARNNVGRLTIRHHGGGSKRFYRMIDFKRNKLDISASVERLEYDPNRRPYIALLLYKDGERRYIIAPKGLKVGDKVLSGVDVPISPGNCLPLCNIPVGTIVHNVEMRPGKGAQLARTAGASVQIISREGDNVTLRLRSGEIRRILATCKACIGEVSNAEHNLRSLGKAGASRWRGIRPTVRGVAMNPVDHPHGGGEGKTSGGRHPVTPYGQSTKGYRTRHNKRTNSMIVRSRHIK